MIPVSAPVIDRAEIERVIAALESGQVSSAGPDVEIFEERWAAYCGRQFGIAVTSGTTALQLAVACLDLQPGDEVIMPAFGIISCALAAVYSGAVPRLVDADPATWCMDTNAIRDVIGPRSRAILPVHIYGHPVDMDPLLTLAEQHGLSVIEDAAEAHGAEYLSTRPDSSGWQRCGSLGRVSCFSFYANKLLSTGEGGMVLTDDPQVASRARLLRNLAFDPARRFQHERLGFNFRMTNLQAALGIPQIARMDQIIERKRAIAREYLKGLATIPGIQLPVQRPWAKSVYWMFGIVLEASIGLQAAELARRLRSQGVDTRPFFVGLHEQPALRARGLFVNDSFPVSERLARQGLYLPSGLGLTSEDIRHVVDAVRSSVV